MNPVLRDVLLRGFPTAFLAAFSVTTAPALAQTAGGTGPGPPDAGAGAPIATLSLWAEDLWVAILDRDGSWYGRLAEEGAFQRFNPLADHEYELDVRTGLFTPMEDARWRGTRNGLRAAGASISHPRIMQVVDWRQDVPVSGSVGLAARYRRERSLDALRDYLRLGVRWRDALGSPWAVEARVGAHFLKASADVEVVLSRAWERSGGARWEVEAGVAALDAFSDAVFQGLGVRAEDVEAHLDHRTSPWAGRISLRRASRGWIAELHAGGTNRSEVAVTFPASPDRPGFRQEERVVFAGVLLQARPAPRLAVALYGTVARADTEREGDASPAGSFALREETARAGVRQRLSLGGPLELEAGLSRVWRPERREVPAGAAVDHGDRETFVLVGLVRSPPNGWTGRLAWAFLDREAGEIAPDLAARNHRLVLAGGWRFATGFEVTAGLGWDLDAFSRHPFDGGNLRLTGWW